MPRKKQPKAVRGVFERPRGSGVWWVNYYQNGKQHREKAGSRGTAIDLYRERKASIRKGQKLPDLRRGLLTLSALIDGALQFARSHNRSVRDYECKAKKVRSAMGERVAENIKPEEIDSWLSAAFKTPATMNRYRAFLSLCYREGVRNGKVTVNPARLVRQRKEPVGRLRFLSREEYAKLRQIIAQRCPEHLAEFVLSVQTGMRLSEQYGLKWGQVHLERRAIDLTKTKNFSSRKVDLNSDAIAALQSLKHSGRRSNELVFPRATARFDNRSWFDPCLSDARITEYVWHGNRHTFCSWLAMAGATTKEIQEAAGFKTINMAARYAHLSPSHRLSVVERITDAAHAGKRATDNKGTNMHQNMHQGKPVIPVRSAI